MEEQEPSFSIHVTSNLSPMRIPSVPRLWNNVYDASLY